MTTEELTALQALLAKMTRGRAQTAAELQSCIGCARDGYNRHQMGCLLYGQPVSSGQSKGWRVRPYCGDYDIHAGSEFVGTVESADDAAGIVALVNAAPALLASAARAAELERALGMIARNGCCDTCQEAALVARKALEQKQ